MKKISQQISLLIICLFITSCDSIINLSGSLSSQKRTEDIDFGSKYGSRLDIYQPSEKKDSYPVIVFYHGGRWTNGTKDNYAFLADAFTSRGYIVVVPDYVKYPAVKFPEWQRDAAKSYAWVHNNISKYKGDPWQTYIIGHSAGAQIGALLATDGQYLYDEQGSKSWIKAFAGLAGPYDFVPVEEDIKDMFGPPEQYKYMQMTTYINGSEPPMLLLWGKDDDVVDYSNIEKVENAIKQKGGKVEVKGYDGVDHIEIILSLASFLPYSAPVADDIDEFFKKNGN